MSISLDNVFQNYLDKMQRIELFLDVYESKQSYTKDLRDLKDEVHNATERLNSTKEYLESDRKDVSLQFIEIMKKMRRNELLMLHLLEIGSQKNESNTNAEQSPAMKQLPLKELQNENSSSKYASEYSASKSPSVARSKLMEKLLLDFEAEITEEQFETIPKYLRGRMQLPELVQFLEKEIIKCFEAKYTLKQKHRKAISNQHDLAIWKEYHLLQANFPDHYFISEEDFTRKSGKLLDKKTYAKFQMLRHLHILQEARSEGTIYFLWTYNK